ncbi:MAG: type I restriction-modification system subunit M [Ruminococcus sp.]|nr:type I restriction-modification system subunit M [Ruminococcus sp.]
MIDNKKEQERAELHRTIWSIANDLRGSVDGWDFKNYVLVMLFYRYISENLTNYINAGEHEAGDNTFDYAKLSDEVAEDAREDMVQTKGFFILPSQLFCNVLAKADTDENLNETLESVFRSIEASAQGCDSEDDFKGLFDDFDVNSNKLGATVAKRNERLVKLMNGVASMQLGDYQENTIDAFGDAYEYLMGMYASGAGKSGGEYFTPQEVSELLTKLATVGKTEVNKVYDPACGSGSLLLKASKILGKDNVRQGFYGQEINITTYNLCRINMFLHDIDYDKFNIAHEDTLVSPQHWDDSPFEVIVSNPPYSIKWAGDSDSLLINDPRFSPAGVLAPKSKADLAFIMHSLSWLANDGVASIVCFPGVMYRGGAEQKIRKYLIENNFIDCIIQLPDNLFYGTSIATCIMVLKKNKTDNNTLFIDASKECIKVTNSNKLTDENITKIVKTFTQREDIKYFCRLVSTGEIAENDYNLSVSTYVEQEDTREVIDISALTADIRKKVGNIFSLCKVIENITFEVDKIYDLINKLCPDGVEYVPLWSVTIWDKKFKSVEKGKQKKTISYPYLLANDLFSLKREDGNVFLLSTGEETGWTTEELAGDNICDGEVVTIPWGKSRAVVDCIKYYKGKFITADNRIATSYDTDALLNKYLYYWIMTKGDLIDTFYRGSGIKHPDMNKVLNLEIPLPPLEVQREIVRVLDNLPDLTQEFTQVLTLYKKQYEYYRDKLLNFKELKK